MIILSLTSGLFAVGLYGLLTRRDLVGVLASAEVMIGGALLALVALGSSLPDGAAMVEATSLLVLVTAAAEAGVGLALVVAFARLGRTTRVDELVEVRD